MLKKKPLEICSNFSRLLQNQSARVFRKSLFIQQKSAHCTNDFHVSSLVKCIIQSDIFKDHSQYLFIFHRTWDITLPFSNMKDTRRFDHHHHQTRLLRYLPVALFEQQTSLSNVLETPIPVVIVTGAKCFGATLQFVPGLFPKSHAHVVPPRQPWRHFSLRKILQFIPKPSTTLPIPIY